MTASGQVLAKEEATVYVRELDLLVTVMLLENTPAVLSIKKKSSAKNFGYSYHWTSGQKPHLIKKGMKIHCDTSRHVPFVAPGLSTRSSTSSISPSSSSQETVTDTEIPRRARTHQHEETRGMNQQISKIQIKMTTRNYRVVSCKVCRIGYRSSSMDWLMKVFQNTEMLPVLLMTYLWSHEQKWHRVNTTSLLISRKTRIAISVLQKTHRYSRAQSGEFW